MTKGSLIWCVARKELQETVRDGRLRLLGGIVLALAITALAFGAAQTHRSQHTREHAEERSSEQWQNQGDKNPHVAAHYGTHVFAPTSAATAIDPGVTPYLGRSVKIEAHKRNLAAHAAAQDAGGQGLGTFTVTTVFLMLLPLLIIALGHGLWGRERERGTLRQLLSTGVDRRALLWGKALALLCTVGAVVGPAALLIVGVLWGLGGGDAGTLMRLGTLGGFYVIYFAIFGGLTLYASAVGRSSRAALVGMVGLWGLFCLVTPRVASETAGALQPLPSQGTMARAISKSLATGIEGTAEREVAVEAIASDMMAKAGVAAAGLLVDEAFLEGFQLKAEAQWEDMVFEHHVGELEEQIAAQETVVAWAGLLSPFVAMQTLSAGLCGTDFAHHRHFTDHAERWRQALILQLNDAFANNAGADAWDYRAGADLWKNAPPFVYESPGLGFALRTHLPSVLSLVLWLLLSLILARRSAVRVRAV